MENERSSGYSMAGRSAELSPRVMRKVEDMSKELDDLRFLVSVLRVPPGLSHYGISNTCFFLLIQSNTRVMDAGHQCESLRNVKTIKVPAN